MAQQVFPPNVIVRIIKDSFFPYRGLTMAPRGLSDKEKIPVFDDDRIISDMENFYYVRLDAIRNKPRGARDWVVVLILSVDGKYSHHSPDLRKLLEGIESEKPTKDGRLDEVILVVEGFFNKKNLTDVVKDIQQKQVGGPDFKGVTPFYNVYPYYNFSLVVPEHKSVFPHRIMTTAEETELFQREHILRSDLGIILTTDAPIIWNGGREGQIVEITRDSQTAGTAIYYRRIEKGNV